MVGGSRKGTSAGEPTRRGDGRAVGRAPLAASRRGAVRPQVGDRSGCSRLETSAGTTAWRGGGGAVSGTPDTPGRREAVGPAGEERKGQVEKGGEEGRWRREG